jgi:hypothetical protein
MNSRFAPEAAVGARESTPRVCPLDTAIASARHLGRIEIFKNEAVKLPCAAMIARRQRSQQITGLMSLYIRNEANNAFSAWLAYRSLCRKTKKERFGKSIFTR